MTIEELLKKGKKALQSNEVGDLEAEILLAYCLQVGREYLLAHYEESVDDFSADLYQNFLKRMGKGEPIAYILGEKEFFGLNFFVDERVLLPRPETEMLVQRAISFIEENLLGRVAKILDVGTGSGNIAVALAKYFENKEVVMDIEALDKSEAALEVARVNAQRHGVENLIHFMESDLLQVVEEGDEYDLILANLPYIGKLKHGYVSENVKKFEPSSALFAGEDGLSLYKKMFQELIEKKVEFKLFLGEFADSQSEDMIQLLGKKFDQDFVIEKDLANCDRMFVINKKAYA